MISPRRRCPFCRSTATVKDGSRTLRNKKISEKWHCRACGRHFTYRKPGATASSRHAAILSEHLTGHSLHTLARRFRTGKKQVLAIVRRYSERLENSLALALRLRPRWSGVLMFAGKLIRVSPRRSPAHRSRAAAVAPPHPVWLCGLDCATGDLAHYNLSKTSDAPAFRSYFRELRTGGYPLHILICPHDPRILRACHSVFGPDVTVQYCTTHFVASLRKKAARHTTNRRAQAIIARIERLLTSTTYDEAYHHLSELKNLRAVTRLEQELLDTFHRHSQRLAAHLLHLHLQVHVPHTLEEIEAIFALLAKRLARLGAFAEQVYADNFLKCWALLYRFTPRPHLADKEAKAPLERAGVNIVKLDWWQLTHLQD